MDRPALAGLGTLILALSAWIVLQRPAPVSTMSWNRSLALVPVVGFLIHYFSDRSA